MRYWNSRSSKAGTACCVMAAGALLIAGCGSDSTDPSAGDEAAAPDVSTAGRMDYACALVRDLPADGSVFDASGHVPESREFAGATRILGAMTGTRVPGYESLSDEAREAVRDLGTIRIEAVNDSITAMADDCADRGLPRDQPNISQKGRVDYGCALADAARTGDYPLDESNFVVGGRADATLTAAASASGLLAGSVGKVGDTGHDPEPDHGELQEPASEIYRGITMLDLESLNNSIDALATACAQRG